MIDRRHALACGAILLVLFLPHSARAQSVEEAQRLQTAGDWAGAERAWRGLVKQNPEDYRLWTSLGIALAQQQHFAEAIAQYQHALKLHPGDPQTELNLGIAFFKMGRLPEATQPLRRAAAGLGNSPQTDILLGMTLYGTSQYKEACPYLERAAARDANSEQLQGVLARAYLYGGQYEKAKVAFERMLARNPDSAEVDMLLGEAYDASGHIENAIDEFRTAAQKGSAPDLHFGLGYLLWKDHHLEEAAAEFQKELEIDPKHYQALAYLGDVAIRQGRVEEGEKLIVRSIALHDGLWLTHFHLGVLDADRKNYSAAIAELSRAATLDPTRPEPHYRLAQIYKATGKSSEARVELAKVTKLHQRAEDDLIQRLKKNNGTQDGH